MAEQIHIGNRGFRVTRNDTEARQSYDPCAGIQFIPPMDTDELFEALKHAYPNGSCHRQRMRQALIEFLLNEMETEKSTDPQKLSDKPASLNSLEGSRVKDFPNAVDKSNGKNPDHKQSSTVSTLQPIMTKPAKNSFEDMTSVWCQNDLKPRRRRKPMTENERLQYRQRRALGVCSTCKKQKRKCRHTNLDIEEEKSTSINTRPKPNTSKYSLDINHPIGTISAGTNYGSSASVLIPPSSSPNVTALAEPKVSPFPVDIDSGQVSTGFSFTNSIDSPSSEDPTRSVDPVNLNLEPGWKALGLGSQEIQAWQIRDTSLPPQTRLVNWERTEGESREYYYSTAGQDDFDLGWISFAFGLAIVN